MLPTASPYAFKGELIEKSQYTSQKPCHCKQLKPKNSEIFVISYNYLIFGMKHDCWYGIKSRHYVRRRISIIPKSILVLASVFVSVIFVLASDTENCVPCSFIFSNMVPQIIRWGETCFNVYKKNSRNLLIPKDSEKDVYEAQHRYKLVTTNSSTDVLLFEMKLGRRAILSQP